MINFNKAMNRVVKNQIDEMPTPIYYNLVKNWYPYYADLGGGTPCFYEYQLFMECLKDKQIKNKVENCSSKFKKLIECIKKNGFKN